MEEVIFTEEMAKEYTILIPNMCPIHFSLLKNVLINSRYKVALLENSSRQVVDEGLKYVHNDTCYPALLVIGQMIDALNSGKYDPHKTALIITQTGGGCRASNYIYLLRKALKKANYAYVPVISLNFSGLDSQPGFKISLSMFRKMLSALVYGDFLMNLENQTKAYEVNKGEAKALREEWVARLSDEFKQNKGYQGRYLKNNLKKIALDFMKIKREKTPKVKVGVVGEIYIKYSALGNNNLEDFLYREGCEVNVPGIMGFMLYSVYNSVIDSKLYGGHKTKGRIYQLVFDYLLSKEDQMRDTLKKYTDFEVFGSFRDTIKKAERVIGLGTKMGEGWLLTGEIMELIDSGYPNVICTQPFGCLPNHIVGKGMVRKIREIEPNSNIVAIDYDPSATSVNQENRIKLMLAIAKENLAK